MEPHAFPANEQDAFRERILELERANLVEFIGIVEEVVERLNRPRRAAGTYKRGDRRRRRCCATCRRFLAHDRRSTYCAACQADRMRAYRNRVVAVTQDAHERAWYEGLDPTWRRAMEAQLFFASMSDPDDHFQVLLHRRRFGVTESPFALLEGSDPQAAPPG